MKFDPYCECRPCTRKTRGVQVISFTNPYPDHKAIDGGEVEEIPFLKRLKRFLIRTKYYYFQVKSVQHIKVKDILIIPMATFTNDSVRVTEVRSSEARKGVYYIEAKSIR